ERSRKWALGGSILGTAAALLILYLAAAAGIRANRPRWPDQAQVVSVSTKGTGRQKLMTVVLRLSRADGRSMDLSRYSVRLRQPTTFQPLLWKPGARVPGGFPEAVGAWQGSPQGQAPEVVLTGVPVAALEH